MTALFNDAHLRYSRTVVKSLGEKWISNTVTGEKGYPNISYSGYCRNRMLLEKSYAVYGAYRRLFTPTLWRLQSLGISKRGCESYVAD